MGDDRKRPPLTPAQEAARDAAAGLLSSVVRAGTRFVESIFDDVVKAAAKKRKAVRDWRREHVGEEPGDLDRQVEDELQ